MDSSWTNLKMFIYLEKKSCSKLFLTKLCTRIEGSSSMCLSEGVETKRKTAVKTKNKKSKKNKKLYVNIDDKIYFIYFSVPIILG